MSAWLAAIGQVSTLVFAVTSMLTVGLSYTIAQILAPLRDGRAVLRPVTSKLSMLALLLLLVSLVMLHLNAMLPLLSVRSTLGVLAFPLGAFGIGHVLDRRGVITGEILALGTAQRNVAAALVVATQNFADRETTPMIVIVSIVTLAMLFLFAWLMGKRRAAVADGGRRSRPSRRALT